MAEFTFNRIIYKFKYYHEAKKEINMMFNKVSDNENKMINHIDDKKEYINTVKNAANKRRILLAAKEKAI